MALYLQFSMRDLSSLAHQTFDLVIIGGGINGAGTAREAALSGLRTLLVEKGDYGSGTSSWSSRLIHGGLRYLEYFEFNLVRESLREREILLRSAPHLVQPLQMTIPIYQNNRRGPSLVRAGMMLYDLLSFDKTLPGHRMLTPSSFRQLFRGVNCTGLTGAAQYYDGQVAYAERLCLENVLSAQAAGATVLNYVKVERLERQTSADTQGERIGAIALQDRLTDQRLTINTHNAIIINTAGPWVDQVCKMGWQIDQPDPLSPDRLMGGTQGSHIIVDAFPGAPEGALYVEAESDGRPYFILPWLGKYLIGTTDLRFHGDLDAVKASDDEIDYLLRETNRVLPRARLTRDDVRFTYAGVRPLPYSEGKKTSSITRRHILHDHAPATAGGIENLISLIGGKLTTYRQVGEELVQAACRKLKRSAPESPTRDQPLPGAVGLTTEAIAQTTDQYAHREVDQQVDQDPPQISPQTINHLFQLYGSRAKAVLQLTVDHPNLGQKLVPHLPDIRAQMVYGIEAEQAQTLVDLCCRRTLVAMMGNYGWEALDGVVLTLQQHCGWSEEEGDRQRQAYQAHIKAHARPDYSDEPTT